MSTEENPESGKLTMQNMMIVKLINGDELVALVSEEGKSKRLVFPAMLSSDYSYNESPEEDVKVEYVRLTNYSANLDDNIMIIPEGAILYMGKPNTQVINMYSIYLHTIQNNPDEIMTSGEVQNMSSPMTGLHLLNSLFTNPDFVEFVNALVENFESETEALDEFLKDDDEGPQNRPQRPQEATESPSKEGNVPKPTRKKKRSKANPLPPTGIPFDPTANPNTAEGWSDNPEDYLV